jgi:hypothetical protein
MADIKVRNVAPVARDKWLAAAKNCPYATYFHTPRWYELIVPGQKYVALEVTFNDGASAVIPMAEIKRAGGLLTDNFSSPGGTYGGWISASALNYEHVAALMNVLASRKNLTFRVNPFDPASRFIAEAGGINMDTVHAKISRREEYTHTLDLTLGAEELYRRTSRCHKRGLRRAAGGGVTVEPAGSWEDWERYYGLYESSLARWRAGGPELKTRSVYPLELFRRLYENMSGHEILWLARKGGEAVAGLLCFYWGRHSVSWHGAASAEFFDLRPNNALYWEAIMNAQRAGYEIFDFNPSGGYGGVESFKDRFGAARVPAPLLSSRTPLRSLISAVSRRRSENKTVEAADEQND